MTFQFWPKRSSQARTLKDSLLYPEEACSDALAGRQRLVRDDRLVLNDAGSIPGSQPECSRSGGLFIGEPLDAGTASFILTSTCTAS